VYPIVELPIIYWYTTSPIRKRADFERSHVMEQTFGKHLVKKTSEGLITFELTITRGTPVCVGRSYSNGSNSICFVPENTDVQQYLNLAPIAPLVVKVSQELFTKTPWKFNALRVDHHTAMRLIIEGALPPELFEKASSNNHAIELSDVTFNGTTFTTMSIKETRDRFIEVRHLGHGSRWQKD
jgi:hypothetical protein